MSIFELVIVLMAFAAISLTLNWMGTALRRKAHIAQRLAQSTAHAQDCRRVAEKIANDSIAREIKRASIEQVAA